jgi:hypothetical protein
MIRPPPPTLNIEGPDPSRAGGISQVTPAPPKHHTLRLPRSESAPPKAGARDGLVCPAGYREPLAVWGARLMALALFVDENIHSAGQGEVRMLLGPWT